MTLLRGTKQILFAFFQELHYGCTCSLVHIHFAHNLNNFAEQMCPCREPPSARNESCSMLPHLLLRFSTIFSCTDDGTDCDSSHKHCCRKNDKDASLADFFISSSIDQNEKKGRWKKNTAAWSTWLTEIAQCIASKAMAKRMDILSFARPSFTPWQVYFFGAGRRSELAKIVTVLPGSLGVWLAFAKSVLQLAS